jgi:hypothetical protein
VHADCVLAHRLQQSVILVALDALPASSGDDALNTCVPKQRIAAVRALARPELVAALRLLRGTGELLPNHLVHRREWCRLSSHTKPFNLLYRF